MLETDRHSFGRRRRRRRPVIANPDLARRWQENLPLNEVDQATVDTDGAAGYTDYPLLAPVS